MKISYQIRFVSIILIITLNSCDNKTKKDRNNIIFNKELHIEGQHILTNSFMINKIYSVDTFLLATLQNNEFFFEIFDAKSLSSLGKFGRKGRGPDDIIGPVRYAGHKVKSDSVILYIYDRNALQLIDFSIPKQFSIDGISMVRTKLSPKAYFLQPYPMEGDKVIGTISNMDIKMDRLRIYDTKQKAIIKNIALFPLIPNRSIDFNDITTKYNSLFIGPSAYSFQHKKFVVALSKLNRIDIFSNNGNLERSILDLPDNSSAIIEDYLNSENVLNTDIKLFYQDIHLGKDHISALFYNHYYKDFQNPKPVEIRIFDWQGNPIKKYFIKEYLSQFTINKNNILFGIDSYTKNIYMYDLNTASND